MEINDPRHPMNSFNRYAREEQAKLTAREIEKQRKLNERSAKNSISEAGRDIGKLGKEISTIDPRAIVLLGGIFVALLLILLPSTIYIMVFDKSSFWDSFWHGFTSGSSWLWSIVFWALCAGLVYYYLRKRKLSKFENSQTAITEQMRPTGKTTIKYCYNCGERLIDVNKECQSCGE